MPNSKYLRWNGVPEVCKRCSNLESDSKDEYSSIYYFCTKGLFMPTKRNLCKIKGKGNNFKFKDEKND